MATSILWNSSDSLSDTIKKFNTLVKGVKSNVTTFSDKDSNIRSTISSIKLYWSLKYELLTTPGAATSPSGGQVIDGLSNSLLDSILLSDAILTLKRVLTIWQLLFILGNSPKNSEPLSQERMEFILGSTSTSITPVDILTADELEYIFE